MYFPAIIKVLSLLYCVFWVFLVSFVFFPPSCAAPQPDFPATLAQFTVLSSFPALLLYSPHFPLFFLPLSTSTTSPDWFGFMFRSSLQVILCWVRCSGYLFLIIHPPGSGSWMSCKHFLTKLLSLHHNRNVFFNIFILTYVYLHWSKLNKCSGWRKTQWLSK